MPENGKKLLQRWGHGAAAVNVNSDCVEVILFGGYNKNGSRIADTVVVRFGECFSVPLNNFWQMSEAFTGVNGYTYMYIYST